MAAFLAKQMIGQQFSIGPVKADMSSDTMSTEERNKLEEEKRRDRLAAIREAEEARKNVHRKMEEQREIMRESVRKKYGIKSKESKSQAEPKASSQQQANLMAQHIAAMNPANARSKYSSSRGVNSVDDTDITSKLLNGNVSGAALQVMNKMQSLLPSFKQE